MVTTCINSPLGIIKITGNEDFITSVIFVEELKIQTEESAILSQCKNELLEYFAGIRTQFTVPIEPEGTAFQKEVWAQLVQIPFGDTSSYGALAKRMNKDERSARAVGHANGQNPIAIIIPCHRVVGENGKLTGYSGGVWRKEWLLKFEGEQSGKRLSLF